MTTQKLDQTELNSDMQELGLGRYRSRNESAKSRDAELETRYGQRLMRASLPLYAKAIDDASDLIRDGYNISTALRRTEVFPSILLQLASTGEDTGELDDLLDRAADYYQKQVDALVERMTTLIEPLLILLVGGIIALMVVLTYLPVFHLGSALQSGL